jgi:hypothetical protein
MDKQFQKRRMNAEKKLNMEQLKAVCDRPFIQVTSKGSRFDGMPIARKGHRYL